MIEEFPGAQAFFPPPGQRALEQLRVAAVKCRGCNLYEAANQTVFGEGPRGASIMFVGEQPGNVEDVAGRPFVGPAGKLLARAMDQAGIPRASTYLTNAVKHFKWTPAPRGKRRIHSKPTIGQMQACRPWLDAEIQEVRPAVIVLLGATAVRAVLGPNVRLTSIRGKLLRQAGVPCPVVATVHPAAVLRASSEEARESGFDELVADLRSAARAVGGPALAAAAGATFAPYSSTGQMPTSG